MEGQDARRISERRAFVTNRLFFMSTLNEIPQPLGKLKGKVAVRITGRLPGEPEALAETSNRTEPREGCNISSMNGRAKGLKEQRLKNAAVNTPDQESNKWLEQGGLAAWIGPVKTIAWW